MDNISNNFKEVNDEKEKLAFNTKGAKPSISETNNVHSIDDKRATKKSLIESSIEDPNFGINLDPFTDIPEEPLKVIEHIAISPEEQLKIDEKVEANLFKEKVKQATQKKLGKAKPIKKVIVLTEEEIIAKKVKENILRDKVNKATKAELKKAQPVSKQEYVKPPTIESIYLDRLNSDKSLFISKYRSDAGNIYRWNNHHYVLQDPKDIRNDITEWLKANHEAQLTSKNVNSIFNVFYYKMEAFSKDIQNNSYIPTMKHWLHILDNGDVIAIKPDRNIPLTHEINVLIDKAGPYTPKAPSKDSLFKSFIDTSLPEDDKQANVQEYVGYSLIACVLAQVFQYWLGGGGNGKGVMMEIIQALLSNSSVAISLENMGTYNDNLINKTAILASETKKKGFDVEFLKAAVAGDKIELRGIRKEKQSVKLIGKWFISGNNDFRVDDFSNGLFRRMMIVNWNATFDRKTAVKDLAKRIINEEMGIFLDWALIGLQRLKKNKLIFTTCEESEKALFNFINRADKVRMFTNEFPYEYSEDKSKFTSKEVIYENFIKYADKNGYEKLSATNFWMRFKNVYPEIDEDIKADVRKNGKRIVYLTRTIEVDDDEVEEVFQ
ncbi:phage/plasmid primase, P4 family, C-terminal domain-containing protein [Methylophilus rhizosphaerae]|uniref:Phage/plasmid primase, P4 family, C-terminal domain-containing protein n=1 Tax=Methylophilus rhizosphaerae TaxID=492660 RepID=A0A1G9A9C5_9PROT|nr:DUF5906 domain-containing protein [Methylophilus rhizosphaerae]SDK23907.1 phage/plasmid primase, P4 family, C-terminal domain-containing protein [Methylophilus rhizosphaerae]